MYFEQKSVVRRVAVAATVVLGLAVAPAFAVDPCDGFTWSVQQERALFAGRPHLQSAGKTGESAPAVKPERLYQLELAPQQDVTFAVAPGKKMLTDGAYAGLATFKVRKPGTYRVSADNEVWIDVVADGKLVPSKDFRGQRDCHAPHKIVQYEIAQAGKFILQLSANAGASVRVAITRAPAPKT